MAECIRTLPEMAVIIDIRSRTIDICQCTSIIRMNRNAMSYVDIFQDHSSILLALGMLFDAPHATFLSERPQVQKIRFCLDNDDSGRMTSGALFQKYCGLGYETKDRPPPEGCKDYNQWLQEIKKTVHAGQEANREEKRKLERCL